MILNGAQLNILLNSEELYRLITENTGDLISLIDQQGCTVYASPSFQHVLGYDPTQMIGASGFDLVHPDDLLAAQEHWGRLSTHGTVEATMRFRHADGSWRWIEARGTTVLQEGTHYVLSVGRDVTERKQAEDGLRASEAHYRALVEKLPLSFYELDSEGHLLSINPAGLQMMGMQDGAQVYGKSYLDVIPESDRAYMAMLLARAFAGETMEIRYTGIVNGQQRVLISTLIPFTDTNSTIYKLIGMTQDITERVHGQLDAEVERDRLDAVLGSSNDAILMVDLDGRVVLVNRAFSSFFGVEADDLLDMAGEQVFAERWDHFGQPEQFLTTVRSLFVQPQREAGGELPVLRPTQRALVWYSAPVRTRAGTSLGRLFIFRDATREKEADQLKTEFISIVSHELRTPLTSIKGFTDLILDGDAGDINPDVREFLEIVKTSADQLVTITDDILETSRIESGKIKLNPQPVTVSEVVQTVATSIQAIVGAKEQTLSVNLPAGIPQVYADRERLVQILTNLLSNAHKYTPAQGRIVVRARLVTDEADAHLVSAVGSGPWVVIDVTDSGIGIAVEDQQHLFGRFYRVSNPETQGIGGTGLGLSITRSLVELHGGAIWLESAAGRGSTFSFSLPAVVHPAESVTSRLVAKQQMILIVEPDVALGRLIRRHLERAGYAATIATSARDALALMREQIPALVTLAIELPDMDGFSLIERLRTAPDTAEIPVIVTSTVEDAERALRLGVAGYLAAPIDERRLIDIVQATLAQNKHNIALVMDDDPQVAQALTTMLSKRGFNVFSALDGQQGIMLARQLLPSLVLLDLWMPEINGFHVLNVLKQHPATHAIPVIAMTDNDIPPQVITRVLSLGATDLLTKPLDMEELKSLIGAKLDIMDTIVDSTPPSESPNQANPDWETN